MLCVPETSVPAEQVFSIAGPTITYERCSLSPDNANMLIFLQKNCIGNTFDFFLFWLFLINHVNIDLTITSPDSRQ